MEPYRSKSGSSLLETEKLSRRVLQLPTGTAVNSNDIEKICDIIRFIIHASDDILKKIEQEYAK